MESKARDRSFSAPKDDRPILDGCVSAGVIILGDKNVLEDVCAKYNSSDKSKLEADHADKLCCLSYDLVKRFPTENETHPYMESLVTTTMKERADKYSRRWGYGRDFVLDHCIRNKQFDDKIPDTLSFLCQIVVPNSTSARKYPNIDLTVITGKTSSNHGDKSTIDTAIRETREETGLYISEYLPNGNPGIFHSGYQWRMRRTYNAENLPYNFKLEGIEVFILIVADGDLTFPDSKPKKLINKTRSSPDLFSSDEDKMPTRHRQFQDRPALRPFPSKASPILVQYSPLKPISQWSLKKQSARPKKIPIEPYSPYSDRDFNPFDVFVDDVQS